MFSRAEETKLYFQNEKTNFNFLVFQYCDLLIK